MHWSLLLLLVCCTARAAAAQDVPAFVCATTEPHPAVQVRDLVTSLARDLHRLHCRSPTLEARWPWCRNATVLAHAAGRCGGFVHAVQNSPGQPAVSRLQRSDHTGRMARHISGEHWR